jgi:hypothetical protein
MAQEEDHGSKQEDWQTCVSFADNLENEGQIRVQDLELMASTPSFSPAATDNIAWKLEYMTEED